MNREINSTDLAHDFGMKHTEVVAIIEQILTNFPEIEAGTQPERVRRDGKVFYINRPMAIQVLMRSDAPAAIEWANEYVLTICNLLYVDENNGQH